MTTSSTTTSIKGSSLLGRSLRLLAASCLVLAGITVGDAANPDTAFAATKTISGELQCRAGDKVASIWILGSKTGWHGHTYPKDKMPFVGKYEVSVEVGETLQVWLRCNLLGEYYTSFNVGSGSTRHICSSGSPCVSINVGKCALQLVFGNKIKVFGCFIRNLF